MARTMRALELLAYAPLTAPQLAAALGAHPRTARRVLGQLVGEEYLVCEEGPPRRYRPTMRLVALAGQVLGNSQLVARARPYLVLAHERTDAVAELVMPSYQSVLCVLRATDGEVAGPAVQEVVPAHGCAGGKVLLAFRERWRDSVLAAPLDRLGERTVTDPVLLRRKLEAVRADGYALEQHDAAAGGRAVAAPVVCGAETVAALQVCSIKPSVDCAYVARLVVRTARELSDALAARPL